jgi:DNA-binding Xre family transcriptional regulator
MAIGKRIEDLARERKINLKELSRQANVSYNTLYAIVKRNNDSVRPDILQNIAKALNVSVDELLGIKSANLNYNEDIEDINSNVDTIINNWVAYNDKTPNEVMEEIRNLPPHYAKLLADYIKLVNKK